MRNPELTPEEIQSAIEKPDLMNYQCNEHTFYYKEIEGKGNLLVFAVKEGEHFNVKCADWLIPILQLEVILDE